MPIHLHSPAEFDRMRAAGRVAAQTLAAAVAAVRPGIRTADIDRLVRDDTARRRATPCQLGYHGFPAAVCTSVNSVVCHGIPSEAARLTDGDIVNIDVTSEFGGYCGDTSRTVCVGTPSPEAKRLVDVARRSLEAGIAAARPGGRMGDIGAAIQSVAESEGCSVVRDYGGHGIGRSMHMDPHVPHVGRAGRGIRLRPGMCFTIEPMINLGGPGTRLLEDGWTVVTADGSLSAQFEHTVLITTTGREVLTRLEGDSAGR